MNEAPHSIAFNDPMSQTLSQIAEAALAAMEDISATAKAQFEKPVAKAEGAFSAGNAFNTPGSSRNLGLIQDTAQRGAYDLQNEPFIARVKVQDQAGRDSVYYFGRNFTISVPDIQMVGYTSHAPAARLAALEVGDTFRFPNGREVEVIETGRYVPRRGAEGWDGIGNTIAHLDFETISVPSLRQTLRSGFLGSTATDDPFAVVNAPISYLKKQRAMLQSAGMRDQGTLNRVQDEIFRLPLARQVMLEGPPGTGKTTTLIKRLAHKLLLTSQMAEEGNPDAILVQTHSLGVTHSDSWIMFSPTELLEKYLSQAFNVQGVPAGQQKVQTWASFRNRLAMNVLGLLRSGSRKTGFQREETQAFLSVQALADQPGLHAALDHHLADVSRNELEAALKLLIDSGEVELIVAAQAILNRLPSGASILATHQAVEAQAEALRAWAGAARASLGTEVARRIEVIGRRRAADIPELGQIVARMSAPDLDDDEDEEDELEAEAAPSSNAEAIRRALRGAIRAMAMAALAKRSVAKTSSYRAVVDWLGDGALAEADLMAMGRQHALIAAIGRVTLVTRNRFTKLPKLYRAFRKAAPAAWFLPAAAEATRLTSEELDLLVAIYLEGSQELLSSVAVRGSLTQGNLQFLAPLLAEFRNQVVVDEATDFSPLQLRAMSCLATPGIRSFFACGDFNQRLTAHGVAGREALRWAVPGLEFHQVTTAYRQSEELLSFADRLITLAGGELLPVEGTGDRGKAGFGPTFHLGASSQDQAQWIAARIQEIGASYTDLPSIAVFVPDEDRVASVAAELGAALADTNIEVEACREGKVLGRDQHVRVFAVDHIKGLEFEAAFFHSVQDLALDRPGLLDKFLYVGATRAATFLGMAAMGHLLPLLQAATEGLADHWKLEA